jgi:hypothetical protein
MKLATFPEVYEDAVRRLARALGGLEDGQLRVARANARLEVRRAIEALRRRLDEAHPVVPKAAKPRSGPRPAHARIAKLHAKGWANVVDLSLMAAFASQGVRVQNVAGKFFAPKWAIYAAAAEPRAGWNVHRIAQAKRSTQVRKALLAARALVGPP